MFFHWLLAWIVVPITLLAVLGVGIALTFLRNTPSGWLGLLLGGIAAGLILYAMGLSLAWPDLRGRALPSFELIMLAVGIVPGFLFASLASYGFAAHDTGSSRMAGVSVLGWLQYVVGLLLFLAYVGIAAFRPSIYSAGLGIAIGAGLQTFIVMILAG